MAVTRSSRLAARDRTAKTPRNDSGDTPGKAAKVAKAKIAKPKKTSDADPEGVPSAVKTAGARKAVAAARKSAPKKKSTLKRKSAKKTSPLKQKSTPKKKSAPTKKSAPKKTDAAPTTEAVAAEPALPPAPPKRRKITKVWYEPRDPRPTRLSATDRLDLPPPASGAALIERVSWAIERELNQIELIVGGHRLKPAQRTEAERRARTLASLARTLAVVTELRAKNSQRLDDDADTDAMPRDLDELRDTLARRLEQILADTPQPADGEPDAG